MASSLPYLFCNLTEGIRKIKCKACDYFLDYKRVKDNLIKYKCLACNKDYSNNLDKKLKKKFKSIFKFYDNDINKFTLLTKKCVDRYENMYDWEKFNETTLPERRRILW